MSSSSEDEEQQAIPDEFICPLTLEIMRSPMMNKYGFNFERNAILEWLQRGHFQCPLTRKPMTLRDLVSNRPLKAKIDWWRRLHGEDVPFYLDDDSVFDWESTQGSSPFLAFVGVKLKAEQRNPRLRRPSRRGATLRQRVTWTRAWPLEPAPWCRRSNDQS